MASLSLKSRCEKNIAVAVAFIRHVETMAKISERLFSTYCQHVIPKPIAL